MANLSDAQFKTLVIRMLTELVEFGHKFDKKMKAMLSETKEKVKVTNSDAKETGTQINGVDQKEERNIQLEKNEETRIKKNEERLTNLQDIFKHSNIRIIGVPEGEEQQQEVENLFEQIMKENLPNLVKEIDFHEAQRIPKNLDPRRHTPRHIINWENCNSTINKIYLKKEAFGTLQAHQHLHYVGAGRRRQRARN